jgi:hypothetical protein
VRKDAEEMYGTKQLCTFLKDLAEVNLDAFEGLTLRFVDGQTPCSDEGELKRRPDKSLGGNPLDTLLTDLSSTSLDVIAFFHLELHPRHPHDFLLSVGEVPLHDGHPFFTWDLLVLALPRQVVQFELGIVGYAEPSSVKVMVDDVGEVFCVVLVREANDSSDGSVDELGVSLAHVLDHHDLGAFFQDEFVDRHHVGKVRLGCLHVFAAVLGNVGSCRSRQGAQSLLVRSFDFRAHRESDRIEVRMRRCVRRAERLSDIQFSGHDAISVLRVSGQSLKLGDGCCRKLAITHLVQNVDKSWTATEQPSARSGSSQASSSGHPLLSFCLNTCVRTIDSSIAAFQVLAWNAKFGSLPLVTGGS